MGRGDGAAGSSVRREPLHASVGARCVQEDVWAGVGFELGTDVDCLAGEAKFCFGIDVGCERDLD